MAPNLSSVLSVSTNTARKAKAMSLFSTVNNVECRAIATIGHGATAEESLRAAFPELNWDAPVVETVEAETVPFDGEPVWHAHVLLSEERNARGGWDLYCETFTSFGMALEAAMELALVIGEGSVFCDAITIGRTDVADVDSELNVVYVNDYANPLRAHLATPVEPEAEEEETSAPVELEPGEVMIADTRGDLIMVEDSTHGLSEVIMISEDAQGHNWVTIRDTEGRTSYCHIDNTSERWGAEVASQLAEITDRAHMLKLRKAFNLA